MATYYRGTDFTVGDMIAMEDEIYRLKYTIKYLNAIIEHGDVDIGGLNRMQKEYDFKYAKYQKMVELARASDKDMKIKLIPKTDPDVKRNGR